MKRRSCGREGSEREELGRRNEEGERREREELGRYGRKRERGGVWEGKGGRR